MDRLITFYKQFFTQNKTWLKVIVIWFVLAATGGIVTFFIRPDLLEVIAATYQDKFGASPALDLNLAIQIFLQNLLASALGLFGGLIFGLGPVLVVGLNGFVLGFVIASIFFLSRSVITSLLLILGGILPHGIFELSAFLIAGAFGLRLGIEWLQNKSKGNRWLVLKQNLIHAFFLIPIIAIVLFIAALVEVFISGKIVDNFK